MAVTVFEKLDSREGGVETDSADKTLRFVILGTDDDTLAYAALLTLSPRLYAIPGAFFPIILTRKSAKLGAYQGGGLWIGTAEYGSQVKSADDETPDDTDSDTDKLGPHFGFDTSGGTAHVTQSLSTLSKSGRGTITPPDFKQAIGVTRDGVQGTDIHTPKFEFTVTREKVNIYMWYLRQLARNTAKTNRLAWKGFRPGEVLFLGASGDYKPGDRWAITYKFSAGENRAVGLSGSPNYMTLKLTAGSTTAKLLSGTAPAGTNKIAGYGIPSGATVSSYSAPNITLSAAATVSDVSIVAVSVAAANGLVVYKPAHAYLWCNYQDTIDNNFRVQIPVAAYVEQNYLDCDFVNDIFLDVLA